MRGEAVWFREQHRGKGLSLRTDSQAAAGCRPGAEKVALLTHIRFISQQLQPVTLALPFLALFSCSL